MHASLDDSVTCIIPTFNSERFVGDAIESVLEQESAPEQIIVVDDGSSDETKTIVRSFGEAIELIEEAHAGVAAARNVGLGRATGVLIAFQDSDDLWPERRMTTLRAAVAEHPAADLYVGRIQNFWMPELAHEEASYAGMPFAAPLEGHLLQGMLIRRTVFDRLGLFDTALRVGSDTDWFMRVRDTGLIEAKVPEVVVKRRLHDGNLTRPDLASRDQLLETMKKSLERRRRQAQPEEPEG